MSRNGRRLFFSAFSPRKEAIDVVYEEHGEGNQRRKGGDAVIIDAQAPKEKQNKVVDDKAHCIIFASAQHEIGGGDAGDEGNRADDQLIGMQRFQKEIKRYGDETIAYSHNNILARAEKIDFNLGGFGVAAVSDPRHDAGDMNGGH